MSRQNIPYNDNNKILLYEAFKRIDENFIDLYDSKRGEFVPIEENQYGTHPAFATEEELFTYLVQQVKTPYDLAVEDGFTGTLTEWLDSLKGEDGNDVTLSENKKNSSINIAKRKLLKSPEDFKMIFVGDSTSDFNGNATSIPGEVLKYTRLGREIEGFDVTNNMPNFGLNGQTIQGFLNSSTAIQNIIDFAPDLIIFSFGINDVRQNLLTKDQLKSAIIQAVEEIREGLPDVDFILRMPNSFLIPDTDLYIKQGSYSSLAEAAQAQTDIIYNAYIELEGYWDFAILFNTQDSIFGREVKEESYIMTDELHPRYDVIVEEIIKLIRVKFEYIPKLYDRAFNVNNQEPYLIYPKSFENTERYIKIGSGIVTAYVENSYMDVSCDPYLIDQSSIMNDIIVIGGKYYLTNLNPSPLNDGILRYLNISGISSISPQTSFEVYRDKYLKSPNNIKPYFSRPISYFYKRRIRVMASGNGYIDVADMTSFDGIGKYSPSILAKDYQLTTSDILELGNGQSIPLTNSSFSAFNNNLRILKSGDYSGLSGTYGYIFGNHEYE